MIYVNHINELQGLPKPENNIILANFNSLYKLEPESWQVWTNAMKRVTFSHLWNTTRNDTGEIVLWLLGLEAKAEENLRRVRPSYKKKKVRSSNICFTSSFYFFFSISFFFPFLGGGGICKQMDAVGLLQSKLVFSKRKLRPDHLRRVPHAHLHLDTLHVNAHRYQV